VVLDPQIFTHCRHWPRFASAHHKPGRGSPQKFLRRTFKIGLKIPHMSAYNFGGSERNLTKLYQGTWLETGVIKLTLILLGGAPYKIWDGRKNPKFSAIFDIFRILSRISLERIDTSKIREVLDQLHFIPYWPKKIWWTFGPLTKNADVDQPNLDFFGRLYFAP